MLLLGLSIAIAIWLPAMSMSAVLWVIKVHHFIQRQEKINESLAHYVEADLKQTWRKSAEELVIAIRGRNELDDPQS
jgi:hypothetical protein